MREVREPQGAWTLAEAGAGEGGGWVLYSLIPLSQVHPQLIAPVACGPGRWAGGRGPLPASTTESRGAGREWRSPYPGLQESGSHCLTLLKLSICSLNNSLTNLSRSIRRKTKPNADLKLRFPLHLSQSSVQR